MSNVYTSYVRIYPVDPGRSMDQAEQDFLLENVAQAYGRHGSYWVRIKRNWNAAENCLDIQYGSGKFYHSDDHFPENKEALSKYHFWEIRADEGGFSDQLLRYYWDDEKGYGDYQSETCTYGFDEIRWLGKEAPRSFMDGECEVIAGGTALRLSGDYTACSDRGFEDLVEGSEYYGPCLGFDPDDPGDLLTLGPCCCVLKVNPAPLKTWIEEADHAPADLDAVELWWQGRCVHRATRRLDKWEEEEWVDHGADFWDNCRNASWLAFRSTYSAKQA